MSSFILLISSFVTFLKAQDTLVTSLCECKDALGVCGTINSCLVNPCDANPCQDTEYCTSDYCGGCNARCSSLPAGCETIRCSTGYQCCDDGRIGVTCCTCEELGLCTDANGACNTEVLCLLDPCTIDNGGCDATQTCTADYCGGCNVICEDCDSSRSCICTADYVPFCCGGTTYGNQCAADCACATNCVEGECPTTTGCVSSNVDCIALYDPVCCDGVTYSNECRARSQCAENCVEGACPTTTTSGCSLPAGCPDVWAPVCCDGVQYGNECEARMKCAENCVDGECPTTTDTATTGCTPDPLAVCFALFAPVCCDGVQYGNECQAKAACAENCVDGTCSTEPATTGTTGCTPDRLAICPDVWSPVCCDGVQYGNECGANAACAENCVDGECPTEPVTTTTTETPVGCTEDAAVCSDGSVLVRSAALNCDFECPDDGCMDTVCCAAEPMTECAAINECEADDGFTDLPDFCTRDVFVCPDGETFLSRQPENCCQFDEDDCEADEPTYCDARMVTSKRASFAIADSDADASDITKLIANCQLCLCSEVGQRRCAQLAANYAEWDEDNVYRQLFTQFCLVNTDVYPALAADDAGSQCAWSDIGVKDTDDIGGCDCSAFYCKDGPNYEPSLFLQSDANAYGMVVVVGLSLFMLWI